MPDGQLLSMPAAAAGAAPASAASAWGFGSWVSLGTLSQRAAVLGLQWQNEDNPSDDATQEILWEIGTGAGGSQVTVAQIPYSFRRDSNIGYFLMTPYAIFFPEPFIIASGVEVWVRVTDSIASALTYRGAKLFYRWADALPSLRFNNYLHLDTPEGVSTVEKNR